MSAGGGGGAGYCYMKGICLYCITTGIPFHSSQHLELTLAEHREHMPSQNQPSQDVRETTTNDPTKNHHFAESPRPPLFHGFGHSNHQTNRPP